MDADIIKKKYITKTLCILKSKLAFNTFYSRCCPALTWLAAEGLAQFFL